MVSSTHEKLSLSVFVSSPYVAPGNQLKRLMIHVVIALLPGTAIYAGFSALA